MEAILALAGLGLAVPGVIEIAIRAGNAIVDQVKKLSKLHEILQTYRTIGIELSGGLLIEQIKLVHSALLDNRIGEELKTQLDTLFRHIVNSIVETDKLLSSIKPDSFLGRFMFVIADEQKLKVRMKELECQRNTFTRLANYVHMVQTAPAATELESRHVQILQETRDGSHTRWLRYSDICITRCQLSLQGSAKNCDLIVEQKEYLQTLRNDMRKDLRYLTEKLKYFRHSEGILHCLGYRQNPFGESFQLLFELPQGIVRRSLSDILNSSGSPPLEIRISLCHQLAAAVSDVHSLGLVHKNIRLRTILVLGDNITHPFKLFLTDWTFVRNAGQASNLLGETDWRRAIYHHPSRQGRAAESAYSMKHDIYSLGVCMLEVLLWKPLIVATDLKSNHSSFVISKLFQQRAVDLGDNGGVPAMYMNDTHRMTRKPGVVYRVLLDLCQTELPACVGTKLTKVVEQSLCCLDDRAFSKEEAHTDGLADGLKFINDVLSALSWVPT